MTEKTDFNFARVLKAADDNHLLIVDQTAACWYPVDFRDAAGSRNNGVIGLEVHQVFLGGIVGVLPHGVQPAAALDPLAGLGLLSLLIVSYCINNLIKQICGIKRMRVKG